MKTWNKLWKVNDAYYTSRAKARTRWQPIVGYFFIGIGLLVLIMQSIDDNFASGLFGLIMLAILGSLFLFFGYMNKRALIKSKSIDKSQTELTKNFFKSILDLFKK